MTYPSKKAALASGGGAADTQAKKANQLDVVL
jgi:hypothetical protein